MRPSPDVALFPNVSAALHETARLQLTVQAYPVPSPQNFSWQKCTTLGCEEIRANTKLHITTIEFLTELEIRDVANSDFGQYKVVVTNGIGDALEQNFYILPIGTNDAALKRPCIKLHSYSYHNMTDSVGKQLGPKEKNF